MALLIFPSSPVNGQKYPTSPAAGVQQYQWSAADSTWRSQGEATGVAIGTYGDANNVGQFTVDAQGRLTYAANVAITLNFVTAPTASTDLGTSGEVAVDSTYLYVYTGTRWQRIAWDATVW
jgi:hypothetical protein